MTARTHFQGQEFCSASDRQRAQKAQIISFVLLCAQARYTIIAPLCPGLTYDLVIVFFQDNTISNSVLISVAQLKFCLLQNTKKTAKWAENKRTLI